MTPNQLAVAVQRYRESQPRMRKAMWESAIAIGLAVAKERNELVSKMEVQWRWLDANAVHPKAVEREDALLENIGRYEQLENALATAAGDLMGEPIRGDVGGWWDGARANKIAYRAQG